MRELKRSCVFNLNCDCNSNNCIFFFVKDIYFIYKYEEIEIPIGGCTYTFITNSRDEIVISSYLTCESCKQIVKLKLDVLIKFYHV